MYGQFLADFRIEEPSPPLRVAEELEYGDGYAFLRFGCGGHCSRCGFVRVFGMAGVSASIAQILIGLFLAVFVLSLIAGMLRR